LAFELSCAEQVENLFRNCEGFLGQTSQEKHTGIVQSSNLQAHG